MVETKGDVNVRVGVDDGPLVAGLKRIGDMLEASAADLGSRFDVAERAYEAVQFAVRESIGAALEAEVAEQRLTSALRQRNIETRNVVDRMNAYNTALSLSTGIGDDSLLGIQSTLVALGAQASQLEVLTQATLGLAEITGKDYAEAARGVAKLAAGNTESLARYGIQVDSVTEAIALLADKSVILTERAETTAGRLSMLANSAGEAAEMVGMVVTGKAGGAPGWLDNFARNIDSTIVGYTTWIDRTQAIIRENHSLSDLNQRLGAELDAMSAQALRTGESIGDLGTFFRNLGEETKRAADETARLARVAAEASVETGFVARLRERVSGRASIDNSAGGILDRFGRTRGSGMTPEEERAAQAEADRVWRNGLTAPNSGKTPGSRGFVGPIDPDTMQFMEAERAARINAQQREIDDLTSHKAVLHQLEVEANDRRFEAQVEAYDKIQEQARAANERNQATANAVYSGMTSTATSFLGNFAAITGAAIAGRAEFGAALRGLAGDSISSVGQMLFQLGSAGVLAGTLGTFIPFFASLTGGPLGVAAGGAAMAAGLGMIALGAGIGGSGSASRARAPAIGGRGGASRGSGRASGGAPASDLFPRSSLFGGIGEGQGTVFVQNINGGFFGGDSRGVARDLRDVAVIQGAALIPRRRRGLTA